MAHFAASTSSVATLDRFGKPRSFPAVDTNTDDIGEYDDIDAGLEGCKTALESMIAELDSLTNN